MEFEGSQQNLGWFVERYNEGSLTLRPPFQRKPVWTARQKCSLVESILMRLPVPEVFIQQIIVKDSETGKLKTVYGVVDGQQRIRTVLQFIGTERDSEEPEYSKFALDKLDENSRFKSLTFEELQEDLQKEFMGYKFSVRYLNSAVDEEIKDMFRRINRYLTPLNAQELRNATYSGPFMQLALKLADNAFWVENRIVSPASVRRMNDVEFVSELMIGVLHGPQSGNSGDIDDYYQKYEDFDSEFPNQRQGSELFQATLDTIRAVLPDIKDTRWSNKSDFYSLFVTVASLGGGRSLTSRGKTRFREALDKFTSGVDLRLRDEKAKVSDDAIAYVRAVEKGPNTKARRGARHAALLNTVSAFFVR